MDPQELGFTPQRPVPWLAPLQLIRPGLQTLGALLFSTLRHRLQNVVGTIAIAQIAVAVLAIEGLVLVIGHPGNLDPGDAAQTASAIVVPILAVVLLFGFAGFLEAPDLAAFPSGTMKSGSCSRLSRSSVGRSR